MMARPKTAPGERLPIYAALLVFGLKLLFLLTRHIQEDAFITWRVAQNLMDYGVIGFNGAQKISASTTHLYVFLSYFFNLIFGKLHFIYPLLAFNSALFTLGTVWLSRMLLRNYLHQAVFILFFGLLPPAIKISILGMEYGLLFFLEMALLYFGLYQRKNWALYCLPPLILFTRIDTVIFLGILFIVKCVSERRISLPLIIGGALGLALALGFNQIYFHEWVNNTITAKRLAYAHNYTFSESLALFQANYGNFWGMLKIPGGKNWYTVLLLIFEALAFVFLLRKMTGRDRAVLVFIFAFGWAKQVIFLSQKSYFDWYYWVPQLLLFVPLLVLCIKNLPKRKFAFAALVVFFCLPMLAFQTVHSIATGNGEWNYRRGIGLFLNDYEKDKNQWIFLEPAGYVPYFSHLKTIDEVGLVDKGVQQEIVKWKDDYWYHTVANRQPKYILSYRDLELDAHADFYRGNYKVLRKFFIKDALQSQYPVLQKIYELKPSGRDYILYQRK